MACRSPLKSAASRHHFVFKTALVLAGLLIDATIEQWSLANGGLTVTELTTDLFELDDIKRSRIVLLVVVIRVGVFMCCSKLYWDNRFLKLLFLSMVLRSKLKSPKINKSLSVLVRSSS